jgi:hypothetical protein
VFRYRDVARLVPRRLPSDASDADRLRYVRHWAVVGALLAIPFWVLVLLFLKSEGATLLFAVVIAVTLLNIATLTWRINRAKRPSADGSCE